MGWKVMAWLAELGFLYGTYSLMTKNPTGGAVVKDMGKLVEAST